MSGIKKKMKTMMMMNDALFKFEISPNFTNELKKLFYFEIVNAKIF